MSLLLWYPFTQDGYNRGMVEGNHLSTTINAAGILGKCAYLNQVTLSTNLDLGGEYSPLNINLIMSTWVKFSSTEVASAINSIAWSSFNSSAHTPTGCIMGSSSYAAAGIIWTSNNIYNGGTRADFSYINVFGYIRGTGGQITTSSKRIVLDKWTHLALVFNQEAKTMSFYVDGELVGTSKSYSALTAITTGRTIGLNRAQVYGGNGPSAKLPLYYNDVRCYDEVLSIKEIRELSKALVVHYTFNDIANEATTNLITSLTKGGQTTVDNTLGTVTTSGVSADTYFKLNLSEPMVEGETYTLQCVGENLPGREYFRFPIGAQSNTTLPFYIYNGLNTYTFVANATAAGKTSVMMDDNYRGAYPNQCVFSHFQLEKKDHATPYVKGNRIGMLFNEAGYDEPISFQNLELTSDTISGSCAGKFDSSKPTQIRTPLDLGGSTDVTIACWLYPQSGTTAFTDNALYCTIANTSISLYAYGRSSSWLDCGSCLTLNAWNHVVVTYSATERVVYVNGVEIKRGAVSGTFEAKSSLDIGYGSSTTRAFNGKIADFRIYRTPLSAEDVLELYESKAAVDKSHNVFTNEIIEQNEVANMVNLGSWEQGGVQDANGADSNNMNNRVRTKYIPVLPNTSYYFKAAAGWNIRGVHFYKKDNTWISYTTIGDAGVRTTPEDCYYVRFIVQNDTASLDALVADIATFGPVMVPGSTATTSGMAADTDVQVTKTYQIKTKDICENHDVGFFKDGTASGNRFHEI